MYNTEKGRFSDVKYKTILNFWPELPKNCKLLNNNCNSYHRLTSFLLICHTFTQQTSQVLDFIPT